MKLQTQPNRWSCLPTSFAMALGVPVAELIAMIGHDGSEVRWVAPEPFSRAGFHAQELIRCAWKLGFSVTEFQAIPLLRNRTSNAVKAIDNLVFFRHALKQGIGVLTGKAINSSPHAVAWDGQQIFD